MKMTKTLITVFFLLIFFSVNGQEGINYLEFPKNTIAATPSIRLFGENGYLIYYKRLIKSDEKILQQLRIGVDFYSVIKDNDESGNFYKTYFGLETLKKINKFSLSYGPEVSIGYNSATNRHIEPSPNSIFQQNITSPGSDMDIDKGSYILISGIGFIGIKYHFSKHFSIGYESAIGLAYFRSTDKLVTGEKATINGFLNDIDPSRFFTIEYSF